MEVFTEAIDESVFWDAASFACVGCRFCKLEKDTGLYTCFAGREPWSALCPYSAEVETRFEECVERFGKDLEESMRGVAV